MGKTARGIVIGLGILLGVVVVAIIGAALFVDVNDYKPQIATAVKKSSGMDLKLKGEITLRVLPRPRIVLRDTQLMNRGSEILATKSLEIVPRLIPLLFRRELVAARVSFVSPRIHVEKSAAGRMNYETNLPQRSPSEQRAGSIDDLDISDGELTYVDRARGTKVEISGVGVELSDLSWSAGAEIMKTLSARGDIEGRSIKYGGRTASNFRSGLRYDRGLANFEKTELQLFGGSFKGSAQFDLRGRLPRVKIKQTGTQIELSQLAARAKDRVTGAVDAVLELEASGRAAPALTKSARGRVAMSGQDIRVKHVDIDKLAGDLKRAQGLNLINIASLFGNPLELPTESVQTESVIQKLTSNWKIRDGLAQAEDVAFSTAKTTVACKGTINLVRKSYQNFFIATVDEKGCAKNKLEVAGGLSRPRPVAGSIGRQIAESHLGKAGEALGSKIGETFGGGGSDDDEKKPAAKAPAGEGRSVAGCDLFYSGSLAQ